MFEKTKKDTEEVRFTDLDAAILLAVNDFRNKDRDFSAHDVTKWIRNECNEGRLKIDSCYNIDHESVTDFEKDHVHEYEIEHHDVRVMVSDFYENEVLKQFGYYNRDFSGGFINYIFSAEVEEDIFTGQIKTEAETKIEKENEKQTSIRVGKLADFLDGSEDEEDSNDSDDDFSYKNPAISTVYGGSPSIFVGTNKDSSPPIKDIDKVDVQNKIIKYIDNYFVREPYGPSLKEVQSRMKGYKITCEQIDVFVNSIDKFHVIYARVYSQSVVAKR